MNYLKDREIWLSNVPTGNPPVGFFWKFIQNGKVVVRDSSGNDQIMVATSGSQAITGSLTVTEGITGTVSSASYVEYSNVADKPTLVSGSSQVTFLGLSSIPNGIVSESAQVAQFGYATTGSNGFNGDQSITGSLTTTGTIVAQTLNVQQVTSSVVFSSGSNIFGNELSNTQQFTGSLQVSGSSHYLLGNVGIGDTNPQSGLYISKYGSNWDGDVQYNKPTGNVFLSMGYSVSDQDNWFGIRGNYGSSSGTANILLQANYRDVNSQAGHYIASKATAFGIADFEIGKLVTSTSTSTPPTKVPQLTISSTGAATFSNSVTSLAASPLVASVSSNSDNDATLAARWTSGIGMEMRYNPNSAVGFIQNTYPVEINQLYGDIQFRHSVSDTMTPRMTIKGYSGNVGIGTTDPDRLFHINGNTSTTTPLQKVQNIGTGDAVTEYRVTGASWYVGIDNSDTDKFKIGQDPLGTSDRFTIVDGGNVGIGTTSPGQLLDIVGTTPIINIQAGANNNARGIQFNYNGAFVIGSFLSFGGTGENALSAGATGTSGYFLTFKTDGIERMRNTTDGRTLLLGSTSSPWANASRALLELNHTESALLGLRINGSERAYFYHNNTHLYIEQMLNPGSIYVISVSGGVYLTAGATSWTGNSDERLKNINGEIENAVDKLIQLRAVNFSWKNNAVGKQNLGLIAQDVEKVFPELIDKNKLPSKANEAQQDETEYLGVRYQELIPVLVKAIQEQQTLIESLKSRIEILEQ